MSSVSFPQLKQLRVAISNVKPFVLDYGLGTLHVKHAGEANGPFWARALKRTNENRGQSEKLSEQSLDRARESDAKLFAEFVIDGWDGVLEDDGTGKLKPAAFSIAKAEAFLLELIANLPDEWTRLRSFCVNADNFRDTPAASGVDLGKP